MITSFCHSSGQTLAAVPRREGEARDPLAIAGRVRRVFSGLERELVGCEDLLIQTMYALLTRENLLLISRPGTAKTLFAKLVFSRIGGARVFELQMSKGTLAEEVVGPVIIEEMKQGNIVHNVAGSLVDADLAFIDEFFDANDMVLRSMLGIFNERWFRKGRQQVEAALHTGIAAANYLRVTDITAAVLDRFLFRAWIDPRFDPYSLQAIDEAYARHGGRADVAAQPEQQIPLTELAFLAAIVHGRNDRLVIQVPHHVLFLKNLAINRYVAKANQLAAAQEGPEVYVSPRTFAKARLLLLASALLHGRTVVEPSDLHDLRYMVPLLDTAGTQGKLFDSAVEETVHGLPADELAMVDELMEASRLAEQLADRARGGRELEVTSFLKRLMLMFHLTTPGEIYFEHVHRLLDGIHPRHKDVVDLKHGLIKRLQHHQRRINHPGRELLA